MGTVAAQGQSRGSIRGTFVPMNRAMPSSAASPPASDGPDRVPSTRRERAGIAAFVVVAVVATAVWLVLLAWLIALAIRQLV